MSVIYYNVMLPVTYLMSPSSLIFKCLIIPDAMHLARILLLGTLKSPIIPDTMKIFVSAISSNSPLFIVQFRGDIWREVKPLISCSQV